MASKTILKSDPPQTFSTSKAVCVGRNYVEHARELNNPVPTEPLLFIKPTSALMAFSGSLPVDDAFEVHYELELTALIGESLSKANAVDAKNAILGIGLGLDLTRRELQSVLKEKGQPWEKAKAFDASGIITPFLPLDALPALGDIEFSLHINNQLRQQGHSSQMITPLSELIAYISQFFTLNPGDIIFSGTPAGVGKLANGDELALSLSKSWSGKTTVNMVS